MKRLALIMACVLLCLPSCQASWLGNIPPVVKDNGPATLKATVDLATQWALNHNQVTIEQATRLKLHLYDARLLIADGTPPATAIDELVALLQEKIPWAMVRQAITMGMLTVKDSVTIPTSGVISEEAKTWLLAVIDGAASGAQNYADGLSMLGAAPVGAEFPDHMDPRK